MKIKILLFTILSAFALPSAAITDHEQEILYRLHSELKMISIIIDEADQASNPIDERQVNYKQLRTDIEQVILGLQRAVSNENRGPRTLPAIKGEYR